MFLPAGLIADRVAGGVQRGFSLLGFTPNPTRHSFRKQSQDKVFALLKNTVASVAEGKI